MGSRGPRPDPRSARSAAGRNTSAATPRKTSRAVAMPQRISSWSVASAFWTAHADELVAAGRLRQEMAESFAVLCELYADCVDLASKVSEEGWIAAGGVNPTARLLRDFRRDFLAAARDFGMTPASDARLPQDSTDGKKEADPEADLLARLKVRRA